MSTAANVDIDNHTTNVISDIVNVRSPFDIFAIPLAAAVASSSSSSL
jgi:hypothetical protein